MGSHKILSPFGIMKSKTKQIDDIGIILLSIDLNGHMKNLYMSIKIRSRGVVGVR
jgi:hypothetical protein